MSKDASARGDAPPPDDSCAFCGRTRGAVRALIASTALTICDGCVALAASLPRGETHEVPACSFCNATHARCQHAEAGVRVCDVCIELCIDILREEMELDVHDLPVIPRAIARPRR